MSNKFLVMIQYMCDNSSEHYNIKFFLVKKFNFPNYKIFGNCFENKVHIS